MREFVITKICPYVFEIPKKIPSLVVHATFVVHAFIYIYIPFSMLRVIALGHWAHQITPLSRGVHFHEYARIGCGNP